MSARFTRKGRHRQAGSGRRPDPPCRRKEAPYRKQAAWELSNVRNGYGYRPNFRGGGSTRAEDEAEDS